MKSETMWDPDHIECVDQCSLCGSEDTVPLTIRPDGLPVHECAVCGFSYLAKRPDSEALSKYYNSGYFQDSQTYQDYYNYAQAIYDLDYCPRLHRLSPFLSQWNGKRVLEIGCAAGGTLAVLKRKGASVTGVEISEEACQVAMDQFGLEVINSSMESVQLPKGSFDVIMMYDVLEHLQNPGSALEGICRLLVNNGYFALTVPNFDRYFSEGLDWPGFQGYWEHLNYFKCEVLCNSVSALGFDIIETHSYTTGLTTGGKPEGRTLKTLARRGRDWFPFVEKPFRIARKMKFRIKGTPRLNISYDNQGMDLFVLARKS